MKDMKVSIRFKKARIEQNLSVPQLSKLSGVSEGAIRGLEEATRDTEYESVIKIADALGIDPPENTAERLDATNPRHREKVCKGCFYWRRLSGFGTDHACHFLLDKGKLCGIDMDNLTCPNKQKMRKYNPVPPVVPRFLRG